MLPGGVLLVPGEGLLPPVGLPFGQLVPTRPMEAPGKAGVGGGARAEDKR